MTASLRMQGPSGEVGSACNKRRPRGGRTAVSDPDRVPDRLRLDPLLEARERRLLQPVLVGGAANSLEVLRAVGLQRPGELRVIDPAEVEAVDVAVRGQPRGDLGRAAGEQVDDAAGE